MRPVITAAGALTIIAGAAIAAVQALERPLVIHLIGVIMLFIGCLLTAYGIRASEKRG